MSKRRRGERSGVCEATGKMGYYSEEDAHVALSQARLRYLKRSPERVPQRVYQCPKCRLWHMTSWEKNFIAADRTER
jgi:hypothetical protein